MTATSFPDRLAGIASTMAELAERQPTVVTAFQGLHAAAMDDGALDPQTKELIALAIGIAVHCDGCIAYHVNDALEAGATAEQIEETIAVAVLMGGGPSMVYGCDALVALKQFQEQKAALAVPS